MTAKGTDSQKSSEIYDELMPFTAKKSSKLALSRLLGVSEGRRSAIRPYGKLSLDMSMKHAILSTYLHISYPDDRQPRHISSQEASMLIVTTPTIEGQTIQRYFGIVTGEAILGANIVRDFFAGITDIVGGRSAAYEEELRKAKDVALAEMAAQANELGANAIVGVDLDYETVGQGGMLMVAASGTAVVVG
jgi:uncharacterized protein YbjQ (UPF0145 family)